MRVKFCASCNHMLYPVEDKEERRRSGRKRLIFMCHSCQRTEELEDITTPVYRNAIIEMGSVSRTSLHDVINDRTLPRLYGIECRCDKHRKDGDEDMFEGEEEYCNCNNDQVVSYQSKFGRNDEALELYYVCTLCTHSWKATGN